ncbi:NHLP bacteriocin export ABC transporter permease/ATPase subunit [Streptomyces goshikiensis]|uniref:NHLP bacteriocin export ABC transporter permease/ATPase subunit n=1 Tax=Streptomyces goshikiensis TaxID=1942 RepID=UPI0036690BDA
MTQHDAGATATAGAWNAAPDPVVAALGALGSPVDCTGLRSLSLEGPLVLWLVVRGELDLFAVDAAHAGHWHFLGRLEPGTLLLGPAEGPDHTLVGRPLQGCLLRRITLRELYRPQYGDQFPEAAWYADQGDHYGFPGRPGPQSPLEDAFARGIGRGLRVLYQAPLDGGAPDAHGGADDDILWMQIAPGSVQYGAVYEAEAVGTLLVDAAMWQGMVDQQHRLLYALDDRIEELERAHEDRTAAGIEAGRAANSGPLVGRREKDGTPVALLWRRGGYEAVDPATGRRERIGKDGASALEPRAVMLYRPLPDGRVGLPALIRFSLRGTLPELRGLLLGAAVAVLLGALVPIATGRVLGRYVPQAENGLIVQTGLALIATGIVSAAFMLLQNTALLRMEGRIEATLQPAVWDRLLRLPTTFFTGRSTGELAGAAMGVSAMRRVLSGIAPVCVQAGATGAMSLVLLLVYSVPLAMAALAMLVVAAAVFLGLGLWQLRHQRRLVELGLRLGNQAFQTLRGLPKLRVAAAESFAYAAWAREFARTRDLQQRIGRIQNLSTVLGAVHLPLCTLVMFVLLAGPARGAMSAGEFLTFSTALTMLLSSVTQLTGAFLSAAAVLPMFEQIRPVLDAAPEAVRASTRPGELTGAIEAKGLSYRYGDDGPLVLDDISFRIGRGEFVAVVGASGCGKSTLLRLLIGFDEPLSGSVLYDGQDLAALDRAAVRRQCGVVLQHAQPFTGSILDCIRGSGTFSLEEVWEAATMAGLAQDIKAMPMGMHTMLSDGGTTVSGGQRQRLMIAQALVRKPRILFFDEATSALDNEAQRVVTESTRALRATRVVIAHRLSTIMEADRVIAMEDGRIVQQGPPAELLADPSGLFHDLVRRQLR